MLTNPSLRIACPIQSVQTRAYRIPTEEPEESDGTLRWSATTLVIVEIRAGDATGMGYTYGDASIAALISTMFKESLIGQDALQTGARYLDMRAHVRNNGREGITAMAISAIDIALWDLKGKLFQTPVCALLGMVRERVPVYGSGGFTSYPSHRVADQLAFWVQQMKIPRVKMKIGRDPSADLERVTAARSAIGWDAELFVDANGAYSVKQALSFAKEFATQGVTWFEEPVDRNDLAGNGFVRAHAPAGMDISNGEYGYTPHNFQQIISAGAADVVQADVTRCGGFTGFLVVDALCEANHIPLSSHCAPYVTLHAAASARTLRHVEYFHDHVLIEKQLFDGVYDPQEGMLSPDLSHPGIGLEFREIDAEEYAI